jgi:hypothetical protein
LSEVLRLARKYISTGYWVISIAILILVFWDRIARTAGGQRSPGS